MKKTNKQTNKQKQNTKQKKMILHLDFWLSLNKKFCL